MVVRLPATDELLTSCVINETSFGPAFTDGTTLALSLAFNVRVGLGEYGLFLLLSLVCPAASADAPRHISTISAVADQIVGILSVFEKNLNIFGTSEY